MLWTAKGSARPAAKRISSTVRFFQGVWAVRKQLAAAVGLVGYTLRARPLARDYWTLSVWKDETALGEFMRTPPHVQLMTSLKLRRDASDVNSRRWRPRQNRVL